MLTKRKEDKELRILRGAIRAFALKGFHGSTIADVAAAAGIAAGTIYLYVPRKELLLVAVYERFLGRYVEASRAPLYAAEPGPRQLRHLVHLHLAFFARDRDLARVFQIHIREVDPIIREGIRPPVRSYFELIETVLRAGVEAERFDPKIELRAARSVIFGALDATVTAWVLSKNEYDLMSRLESVNVLLARALGTDPARA